jgi:hypothetical protein
MAGTFLAGLAHAQISNAVVVALDDETSRFATSRGAPCNRRVTTV